MDVQPYLFNKCSDFHIYTYIFRSKCFVFLVVPHGINVVAIRQFKVCLCVHLNACFGYKLSKI